MSTTPRATAAVRSPAELITLLPYQLGYRPHRSLVAVTLRHRPGDRTTLGPVLRVDLPAPQEAEQLLEQVAEQLLQVVHAHGATAVLLVAFEDGEAEEDVVAALGCLAAACTEAGDVEMAAVARVRGDHWCRLDTDGQPSLEALVTPRWERLPDPGDVPAVADFVMRGHGVVRDRATLCAPLDGPGPVPTHDAVRGVLGSRQDPGSGPGEPLVDDVAVPDQDRADRWAAVWAHVVRNGPDQLAAGELALLVRSLRSLPFRDALLWWLTPAAGPQREPGEGRGQPEVAAVIRAMLPTERPSRGALIERLYALAVRTPPEQRGPVLSVLGMVAWWHGDGTVANIAVERALRQEPGYGLARLLDLALQRAVPPPGLLR